MNLQERTEQFAAKLEKNQTRHERWLGRKMKKWCERKDLLCHPQIAMHGYIVDFYFPQIDLAIELDGPSHNAEKDARRDACLLKNGVQTVRFPNPKNNAELNQVLYRIYAEASYQITRAKNYTPGRFSTNTQPSQRSKIISNSSNKETLVLDERCAKVKNQPNTRQVMAKKAANSEAQICADCGNPRWMHYCALRHNFQKPKAVA